MCVAGKTAEMSVERIQEIKEVNPNFISVIGNVEPKAEEPKVEQEAEEPKAEAKAKKAKNKE